MKRSADKPLAPCFRPGDRITETGIYRVFHGGHRVVHEVTVIAGEVFPRCSVCGCEVHFELLRAAPEAIRDSELRGVRLYEIPHPDDEINNEPTPVPA